MKHYRVKQGDTLESIAEAKKVEVSSLRAANTKIRLDRLRAGQILVIPDPEPVPEPVPETVPDPIPETVTPDPEPAPVEEKDELVPVPRSYLRELNRLAEIGRAYLNASEAFRALPESKELLALVCPNT